MKISEIFGLENTQIQLEFVDIDLEMDYALYIDPFLIAQLESQWSISADETIKNFFNTVVNMIIENKKEGAIELFEFMSEPKETCLGLSKSGTTNGKGVGNSNADEIIEGIIKSGVIEEGLVKNIEDIIVFVDNVGKDKLSDMVTNLIRYHLLQYTKKQCEIWGFPMTEMESLPYWNPQINDWDTTITQHLMIDGRNILLVPKFIVSKIDIFSSATYNWFFAIEEVRNEHLERRSALVKYRKYKNGREKYSCSKKDVNNYIGTQINNGQYMSRKDFLRKFTLEKPYIFENFVAQSSKKIKPMTHEEMEEFVDSIDIDILIDNLVNQLSNINTGREAATEYHMFIRDVLELLFYPYLVNPSVEEVIHDGRKRIDIVLENNSKAGFFHNLHNIGRVFCPYVYIECKNYGQEVANPEIDQLAGRFSDYRGKFGILMCRSVMDRERLIKRCQDTYKDGRGLIIPLLDEDIRLMLQSIKEDEGYIQRYLEAIKKNIVIS